MDKIEKIRAEIERLKDSETKEKKQPDKSLEEEIEKCWKYWLSPSNQPSVEGVLPKSEFMMYARHFAEWQKEQDTREMIMSDGSYFQKCYEQGKKDMKEQMLKEAVEGRVFMSFAPGHNQMVMADVDLPTNTKVRIIVLKAEEE